MSLARPRTHQALTNIAHGLRQGLSAYWTMEETSGDRADSIAGLVLTDTNTATSNPGIRGNAAQFTAANNESLQRATTGAVEINAGSWTIQAWTYQDSVTGFRMVVSKDVSGTREYQIYYDATGDDTYHAFVGNAGSSIVDVASLTPVVVSTWYHILAWHDRERQLMFIQVNQEEPVSASTSGITAANGARPFIIGDNEGSGSEWSGRIDEVAIWKRVLTIQERKWLYNNGNGRTYPF